MNNGQSPEKSLRKLRSHQQLSSTVKSHYNPALKAGSRPVKDLPSTQLKTTDSLPNTRSRANSDLPTPFERTRVSRRPLPPEILKLSAGHARKSSIENILRDGPAPGPRGAASLNALRHSVLTTGVQATKEGMSDYRVYLWLTLLNVPPLPTHVYLDQIHRGRSPAADKIANDVFRTLATDTLFKKRVTDASLTRVLNATAWRIHDARRTIPSDAPTIQSTYIQGMNVLLAPLQYASRSEAQAYALLTTILNKHIPTYLTAGMSGVHAGVELIDKILATISPNLSQFLLSNSLPAKVYAFPSVLTLCACTPPLPEVLKLWDFLFAYGTHLNILCVVAQIMMMKDSLLDSASPGKLLRSFPNLKADEVIRLTLVIVRDLPDETYAEVVRHGKV